MQTEDSKHCYVLVAEDKAGTFEVIATSHLYSMLTWAKEDFLKRERQENSSFVDNWHFSIHTVPFV